MGCSLSGVEDLYYSCGNGFLRADFRGIGGLDGKSFLLLNLILIDYSSFSLFGPSTIAS